LSCEITRILLKLFLNNLRPASSLGIFQRRRGGVVGCDRAVAHQQHRGGGPRLVAPAVSCAMDDTGENPSLLGPAVSCAMDDTSENPSLIGTSRWSH